MEHDSFLKKFQGRTEVIGRGGLLDIMNNVHINVNDYQVKPKKPRNSAFKRKKSLKEQYNYVTSEVSEEFNKNKNFTPQLRSLSISSKSNKNSEINKNNENNKNTEVNKNNNQKKNNSTNIKNENIKKNRNNKSIEISKTEKSKNNENKKNNTTSQKNKIIEFTKKQKEKPIKLFIYTEENNNKKQNKENKKSEEMKNNIKISQSPNKNKKSQIIEYRNKINKNKLNIQLPSIVTDSASPKNSSKNNLRVKPNKSYDRANTFTPKLKNSNKYQNNINNESEKNYQSLKEILGKKIKNDKKGKNENFQNNSLSLPKIDNKRKYSSPNKNIKEFSNKKNNDIQKEYNNILNNIKNDFLLLDSIKNRSINLTERNRQSNNSNYQINNKNNNYGIN